MLNEKSGKALQARGDHKRQNDDLCKFLEAEIKWCEEHRGTSEKSAEFENGFIAGIKQAILFAERT